MEKLPNPFPRATDLEAARVVAIIRAGVADADRLAGAVETLWRGGVRAVEVTLNTPGAFAAIAEARRRMGERMWVGAGTILTAADARAALSAGAQFVVTPTLQLDSIAVCAAAGVPIFCGCLSPTEALAAHRAGADFIKLFPATAFGLSALAAVRSALPQLRLVPTGGVSAENVGEFLRLGCPAVAVGSALVSADLLHRRDWPALEARAAALMGAVRAGDVAGDAAAAAR